MYFFPQSVCKGLTMRGRTFSLYDSSGIERKRKMKEKNASSGYFVLLGFSNWPHLELVLFVVVLMFYLMTLIGNLFIIFLSFNKKVLMTGTVVHATDE